MSASVGYSCSVKGCKQVGYVTVSAMIAAGKEFVPKGWGHYDLGIEGPEEYNLCPNHTKALSEMKKSNFRSFVNGEITWEIA